MDGMGTSQDPSERLYAHRAGRHLGNGDPWCLLCQMYRRRADEQPEVAGGSSGGEADLDPAS